MHTNTSNAMTRLATRGLALPYHTTCALLLRATATAISPHHTSHARTLSTSPQHRYASPPPTESPKLGPRWLSDAKSRLGKCILFGMTSAQTHEAGLILAELARDWKSLLVGSEGFLVDKRVAGITSQAVVWGEQDSMGHVNNVVYVRYAESGRCNWMRQVGEYFDTENREKWFRMLTNKGVGLILKSITVDYKFPMTWPDRVSVFHKLRERPGEETRSIVLDVCVLSEGKQRIAARAVEDVVVYDYGMGGKTSLPEWMLRQFLRQWEEQERVKEVEGERVRALLGRVRELERQTWDREGAVEDLGGAK